MVEILLFEATVILIVTVLTARIIVVVLLLVVEVFIIISWGLNWKSNTIGQVWKWVDQLSLLSLLVVEGAAVTILAFSKVDEVLAWLGLVVGVDSTEGSLSEVLWEWLIQQNQRSEGSWGLTYVIWLSQLSGSVSELAELHEWAVSLFHEMFAHLGLIFLLELVELTLVSVEVVIVVLLGEMSENFTWWVVKVSWSAVSIITLTFISLFLGCGSLFSLFRGHFTSSRWFDE